MLNPKEANRFGVAGEVAQGVGAARAGLVFADRGFDQARAEFVFHFGELVVGGGAVGDANKGVAALDRDCLSEFKKELRSVGFHVGGRRAEDCAPYL